MKKTLLVSITALMFSIGFAQNATNFNCNDCSGINHDLFTELDAGKIIVICWVMPCGSCVGPALTTYNVVQSFENSHPDKVFYYLVDDYANTNCSSLGSWANSNGIAKSTLFSNSAIQMEDYGSPGMPKIVVVGDVDHAVFYNANNTVNATALQEAINTAINASLTEVTERLADFSNVEVYPNPSIANSTVVFFLEKSNDVKIEIIDQFGRKVSERSYANLSQGEQKVEVNTGDLSKGIYFVRLTTGIQSKMIRLAVAR